jgi:hypothetical protein
MLHLLLPYPIPVNFASRTSCTAFSLSPIRSVLECNSSNSIVKKCATHFTARLV